MTEEQRKRRNAQQQAWRKATSRASDNRWRRTVSGFLCWAYRRMAMRVAGKHKPHLYKGLSVLPREDFYRWSRASLEFQHLYRAWVQSGYDKKLSPSVNRIDPTRGYDPSNIEWLTHSMNSALGGRSPKRRKRASVLCLERIFLNAKAA